MMSILFVWMRKEQETLRSFSSRDHILKQQREEEESRATSVDQRSTMMEQRSGQSTREGSSAGQLKNVERDTVDRSEETISRQSTKQSTKQSTRQSTVQSTRASSARGTEAQSEQGKESRETRESVVKRGRDSGGKGEERKGRKSISEAKEGGGGESGGKEEERKERKRISERKGNSEEILKDAEINERLHEIASRAPQAKADKRGELRCVCVCV